MDGLRSTPSLMLRGVAAAADGTGASLRAMNPARRLALLVAAGLFAALWAPWYDERVRAHGLSGARTSGQTMTGWQALPVAAIVCALAALAVAALLLMRSGTRVEGLGALGRRAARARVDGALVATAGGVCVIALLWTVIDHPGLAAGMPGVAASAGIRWGVALALVLAAGLAGLGARIAGIAAFAWVADHLHARRARPRSEPAGDPGMPDFDFAVGTRSGARDGGRLVPRSPRAHHPRPRGRTATRSGR